MACTQLSPPHNGYDCHDCHPPQCRATPHEPRATTVPFCLTGAMEAWVGAVPMPHIHGGGGYRRHHGAQASPKSAAIKIQTGTRVPCRHGPVFKLENRAKRHLPHTVMQEIHRLMTHSITYIRRHLEGHSQADKGSRRSGRQREREPEP